MHTDFYWAPRRRWVLPLWLILGLLVIGGMYAEYRTGWPREWLSNIGMWYIFLFIPMYWSDRALFVFSHGALIISRRFGSAARAVPLSTAEFKADKGRFRWPEGRRHLAAVIPTEPALVALVEKHGQEPGPARASEALRTVSVAPITGPDDRKLWAALALFLACLGLGLWLNQPLFLLPVLAVPVLAVTGRQRRLVLTLDALWVTEAGQPPLQVAREGLTVRIHGNFAHISCEHGTWQVNRFTGADIVKRLQFGNSSPM